MRIASTKGVRAVVDFFAMAPPVRRLHMPFRPTLVAAAALLLVVIDASYARRYFFLFDDFALVGQASTFSVHNIVTSARFGFYRPVVFLLVKAEWWAFSWRHPA